jgi:hypothetical protein
MTTRRITVAGLVAGLALALAACSSGSAAGAAPTATAAPATPHTALPSIAASIAPPSAADTPSVASPTPPTSHDPIAEGTYTSQPVAVTAIVARISADTTITASQQAAAIHGFSGYTTQTITLDFRGGQFVESEAFDGGPFEVGARASYAFPDDHTLVIQEVCCGLSTFTITPAPGGFSLMYKVGAPNAGEDAIGRAAIYEIGPFTLMH